MYISYRTPGIGYYNGDEYPDVMLQFSIGLGFPIYDYESVSFETSTLISISTRIISA